MSEEHKVKHTPGPWEAVHFGDPDSAVFADGKMIAVVKARAYISSGIVSLPFEANAELMAQAPTLKAENERLLKMLEDILQHFQGDWPTISVGIAGPPPTWLRGGVDDETRGVIICARAIIAEAHKARGGEVQDE